MRFICVFSVNQFTNSLYFQARNEYPLERKKTSNPDSPATKAAREEARRHNPPKTDWARTIEKLDKNGVPLGSKLGRTALRASLERTDGH